MRVLIWAKLSPDELTVDLTTRSEFVNQTNVFKFYRKHKEDDTIVRDTYFPNKLSCRGNALPNGCLPSCFMPWAAKFQCFAQSGSPVSPPGTSIFDEPISIISISREPFRIVYRSNSIAGGSLRCQFDRLRDDARIPTDTNIWPAESYPISGTITYEPVSGDKFQLVICEDFDLQRSSVPIGELPACALVILGAGTTLEDWNRSSEQIRFAIDPGCRDETDEQLAVGYSNGDRLSGDLQYCWSDTNRRIPAANVKFGWYRETFSKVESFTDLSGPTGQAPFQRFSRSFCWPHLEMDVGTRWNLSFKIRGPAGRLFRDPIGLALNGSFGAIEARLPAAGGGAFSEMTFEAVSHLAGTPTWRYTDGIETFQFVPELSNQFNVDFILSATLLVQSRDPLPGLGPWCVGTWYIQIGNRELQRQAMFNPTLLNSFSFGWFPSYNIEPTPIWNFLFDYYEEYAYQPNGFYDDQKPASIEWLNFGLVN